MRFISPIPFISAHLSSSTTSKVCGLLSFLLPPPSLRDEGGISYVRGAAVANANPLHSPLFRRSTFVSSSQTNREKTVRKKGHPINTKLSPEVNKVLVPLERV